MEAIGGRASWDASRYFVWNFLGRRKLYWDKQTGDVRIDWGSRTFLINVQSETGTVFNNGEPITDSLDYYVDLGRQVWVNDSYWLVMPFKLKDSGVTLKYEREDTTKSGVASDVLSLAFDSVGYTPQNQYEIFVDQQNKLIREWKFFQNASDDTARFTMPWDDYQQYGNILLAGDHGRLQLTEIQVLESLPESIFTSSDPVSDL